MKDESFSKPVIPQQVHGFARNQREEGFVVNVEPMHETPLGFQVYWASEFLNRWVPDDMKAQFSEIMFETLDRGFGDRHSLDISNH